MAESSPAATDFLLGGLLRSVSRSFYLSIRFLPSRLREPVGLAYLLARATDTLADTTEIDAEDRKKELAVLASAIQQDDASAGTIEDLRTSFAPRQTNPAERQLIDLLPEYLALLGRIAQPDRHDIRDVLLKINRAQLLDLERFGTPGNIQALRTVDELTEYTYLIAGCVGEFWTQLCSRHLHNFAELPLEGMLELGRNYGVGLQLINISRDVGADLRAGRCYFPEEELHRAGIEAADILDQPVTFLPVLQRWLTKAEECLKTGMQYCLAIRNRRVRAATVLPALIGARTLALLQEAGASSLDEEIKMPRQEVRKMLGSVALTLASKTTLNRMFWNASQTRG